MKLRAEAEGFCLFLFNRKFLRNSLLNKNLSEGCAARGREVCLAAPLAREVCASTHFFINKRERAYIFPGKFFLEIFPIYDKLIKLTYYKAFGTR